MGLACQYASPLRQPETAKVPRQAGALLRAYALVVVLVLLVLVLDAEEVLGLVLAGLNLAVVLVPGLVAGEVRGLVERLVGLLVVVAGEVLGLVSHLTEVRHGASYVVGCLFLLAWLRCPEGRSLNGCQAD